MQLFSESHLFQDAGAPRRPWAPKTKIPKTLCVPQLREFSVELAFLTLALSGYKSLDNCVVVYAGAASGNHIPSLASLFPSLPFYLYDPHKFDIKPTSQIYIMREKFTDQLAAEWGESPKNVIFISDIRTSGFTGADYEKQIHIDMITQARWVEIMKPAWWSVEFRIPYPVMEKGEKYPYLGGWLLKEPFAKQFSTKMRLMGKYEQAVKGRKAMQYDSKAIEEMMFYHNTVVRTDKKRFYNVYSMDEKRYHDDVIDNSYDFTYFLFVLDNYKMSPHSIPIDHSVGEAENLKFAKDLVRSYSKEVTL